MNKENIKKWIKEVKNIKKLNNISMPLNIFLEESASISGFIERFWEATDERPGLSEAMPIVAVEMAEEITALVTAISVSHNEALRIQKTEQGTGGAGAEARAWIREMQHFLKWVEKQRGMGIGPGVNIDLARFNRAYLRDKKDAATLAQWMADYHTVALQNETALIQVPGYDPAILEKGTAITERLRVTRRGRPRGSDTKQAALDRRRQLTHVLAERVRRVRSAARFVFRNHPEIRKLVTSDFERRRRRQNRAGRDTGADSPQ